MEKPAASDPKPATRRPPGRDRRAGDWRTATRAEEAGAHQELVAFRTMLELSSDAHAYLDEEGRFLWANHVEAERLGRSFEELRGLHVWDVDPIFTRERYREVFDRARNDRIPPFESENVRPDGSRFPIEVTASVVELPDGPRLFASMRDITDRKEAEWERERLLTREREAREEVTTILESITDAFFAVDREWRFTYVNREAERVLQRPREELLGRTLWEEFATAIGTTFEREYHRAMEEQTTVRFEEFYPPLDAWFEVRAFPTAEGLSVYFSNATDRKLAEARLRASEERYRLLVNMIPQHIWTTDPDGYHRYFSRRWYDFTGATHEDTKGEGWLELLHPDDRERTIARWHHSLQTGKPYSIEYRFRRADGEYCWFLGQATPLRDELDGIVEWFGTLTDISDRKRLEQERERLLDLERDARAEAERRREELERVSESRTRLMRGFTHDVKNPLGAVDGYAQLLEDGILGELSPKQVETVRRIRRSLQTSLHLIQELLELARAEAGQIELEPEPISVGELAREAAEDFRAQASAAGLELEIHVEDVLPTETDPARVRQVLSNLLSNAAKYSTEGTITVGAELRTDGSGPRDGDWITIRVCDEGPGIPPAKQETIFEEFTRLDPAAQEGAGVGLAISRRIARLLGGEITVESEVGRGSTFTLWLPLPSGD